MAVANDVVATGGAGGTRDCSSMPCSVQQQAIAECIYARRFLAAMAILATMTILGVASGSGTLGVQRSTGGGW